MSELKFDLDGLKLSKISGDLPCNTCKFLFKGNEWNKCKAVAVFERSQIEYASAIHRNGECKIPDELMDSAFFRVRIIRVIGEIRSHTNTVLITKEV